MSWASSVCQSVSQLPVNRHTFKPITLTVIHLVSPFSSVCLWLIIIWKRIDTSHRKCTTTPSIFIFYLNVFVCIFLLCFFFSTLRTKTYVRRYKHTYEYVQFVYKQKLLWKETKMKKSFLFFRVSICFCITLVKTDRFLLGSYEKGWGKRKYLYSFSFWEGESKRGTARANYNCTWYNF